MSSPPLSIELMNEALNAMKECSTKAEAARLLGIPETTFRRRYTAALEYYSHEEKPPRVLFYDLETSYSFGAFFAPLYDMSIPPQNVLLPSFLISAQWQWMGEDKRHSVSLLDDMKRFKKNRFTFKDAFVDDYHVAKTIYDQLSQADIVIAHNNDQFDAKKINTGILKHGFKPLHRLQSIDTLKEARKNFKLESNSLDYLARYLDVPRKKSPSKDMFLRASMGDIDAIRETAEYGLDDLPPLIGVYYKLRPFMKSHPNMNVYMGDGRCPVCASKSFTEDRDYHTRVQSKHGYRCNDCNHYFTSSKTIRMAKHK